ncbi:transcription antitermination factor NusB [Winogradskyella sp. PC-19]|uniref:transcription antitermination factor NusB n=2 Tax=unclassified Winogradskyella TaxID=2615021 RepID=UPI000B3C4CA8|nr:transcription antitermination factor NusB [Winogradskyella sp. PC-19]ARV10607.1 transcription antitermination factor NusB [Winogradskyella sp. PC-19]RZN82151.1 MAG: transcription antitermination factor NusB [Winogradskyella sp.]
MQSLFAFKGTESDDFKKDERFLFQSIDKMSDLYFSMLALLIELQKKANSKLELSQKKLLATKEDINPNRKFADNAVLQFVSSNTMLKEVIEKRKLNFWDLDFEYVDVIYKAVLESDLYKNYMAKGPSDLKEDKDFIIDIYTEIIAPNDKLYDYFEDQQITWVDDLPVINTAIVKTFTKLKLTKPETFLIPELYKDEDDRVFAKDLLYKTLLNRTKFVEEIAAKTTNWDADRLASLDGVLLQMALCEFQKFPSIPVKVTINEYLEIAKEYSTPKSSVFINGILDKIVKEYKENNVHNKIGRGLM